MKYLLSVMNFCVAIVALLIIGVIGLVTYPFRDKSNKVEEYRGIEY